MSILQTILSLSPFIIMSLLVGFGGYRIITGEHEKAQKKKAKRKLL